MTIETVLFSRLPQKIDRGGGCKRECQLAEILAPLKVHHLSYEDSRWFNNPLSPTAGYRLRVSRWIRPFAKYWHPFYRDYVVRMLAVSRDWRRFIKKNPTIKLALVNDPLFFFPLVNDLKRKNIPIVALCQNIESLSYSQITPRYQQQTFNKEINLLKECTLVVSISQEETVLLQNFNVPALYLPYYPVAEMEIRLLKIRKHRLKTKKKGFLLLGNVWNKVTLEGMKRLIDHWQEAKIGEELLVAGFGTPKLLPQYGHERISLLGELTARELDEILTRVTGMICYQEHGSGALTKIQEMLLAGVPVIANPHAARSYYSSKGLWLFQELDNLANTIERVNKNLSNIPPKPVKPDHQVMFNRIELILNETQQNLPEISESNKIMV